MVHEKSPIFFENVLHLGPLILGLDKSLLMTFLAPWVAY